MFVAESQKTVRKTQTNVEIAKLAEDTLGYLDYKSGFWQMQQPLYSR